MAGGLAPLFGAELLPTVTRIEVARRAASVGSGGWLLFGGAVLSALDGVLLIVASRRFRRPELVLD